MECRKLIDKLNLEKHLDFPEWVALWSNYSGDDRIYAGELARDIAVKHFGQNIYIRGIVEFSNRCGNDCFYCGIRKSNNKVQRYTLSDEVILDCCETGYLNGIRTFVLQSGEAVELDLEHLCRLVRAIKSRFADCAVTLSLGELSFDEYASLRQAGADRYLLRHETADAVHYRKMHPKSMSLENRMECLRNLKKLGFQTGCGIMTGSPFQSAETLAQDMLFMESLQPEMVGIGPFIPHKDTPFAKFPAGTLDATLMAVSLCRIMLEKALLPSTTALGALQSNGRELGILAGANVVMPNLTPPDAQDNYILYENKKRADVPSALAVEELKTRFASIGYTVHTGRGDIGG